MLAFQDLNFKKRNTSNNKKGISFINYLYYVTRGKLNLMYCSLETTCNFNGCFVALYLTELLKFIYLVTLPNEQVQEQVQIELKINK